MKGGSVFNTRPALELPYKITAMDAYQNQMFTGDEKGNIYKYIITPDDVQVVQANSMVTKSITRSRIEQIKVLPFAQNNLLVISDSTLFYIESQGLKFEPATKEKVVMFTLNEFSKNSSNEIALVTKKKEGMILQFNSKTGKFEQLREKFLLPDIPITIAFINQFFYLGILKKNYQVIKLDEKQQQVLNLPIEIGNNPYIKATDADEILIITTNNVGIFVGRDGQIKPKNTLNLQNKPFLSITIFKPYLIVLFETVIQVYNLADAKQMSDFPLTSQARCITQSSTHLFYGSATELIYLHLTPPEQQIQELLKKGLVEEAISVYTQYNQISDPAKNQQLEQLKLDCAWALVRQMNFTQALNYLGQVNYEPRDFICLFPDYYYAINKLESVNENPSKYTISLVITQTVQEQFKGDQKKVQDLKQQAREFLISVLERKREQLTSPQYAYSMKDKLNLMTSTQCFNQNQWHAIPCDQLLELIDFALIKAYVESQQYPKLKQFLGNQIYCVSLYADLQALFQSNKNLSQGIQARFYESFNKIDMALSVWKAQGEDSNQQAVYEEACEESVRIMKSNPDRARIQKYIVWVFKKQFAIGSRIFGVNETVISPDQMFKFLEEIEVEPELKRRLKERYLEVLVLEKQTEEERFHTQLAYSYIDACFSIIPKNTDLQKIDFSKNPKGKEYYQNLRNFLSNPNSKYNASSILEKRVQDSWMIPELIQLYGREKRHDDALNKLINLSQFDQAEKYCCSYTDQLLTKLFKKYIEFFTVLQQKVNEKPTDANSQTMFKEMKTIINNFLKKYATHSQLNPLQVLELIPEKWILADSGSEDGLFQFLNSVISHTLHQKRSTKAAYHLSDMDLLNVECMFAEAKQANIKINPEKKCAVCNRSIGDKVFVVYPNAVVAHHTCIKNNTICPTTEKDFEKYFKF